MAISFRRGGDTATRTVTPASAPVPAPRVDPTAVGAPAPAAADPQRALAASVLVDLYGYLQTHAEQHLALAPAIPALRDAVAAYRTGQAADPLAGPRAVYAVIEQARSVDPSIPEA
jgi:hypothetical protein